MPLSKDAKWNDDILVDLEPSRQKLNNVFIENMDFLELIEKYEPKETCRYLDPPYFKLQIEMITIYIHLEDDHLSLKKFAMKLMQAGESLWCLMMIDLKYGNV